LEKENMSRIHILKGFSDLDGALRVLKFHPGLPTRQEVVCAAIENGDIVTDKNNYYILLLLSEWGLMDIRNRQLTQQGGEFYSLWEMKQDVALDVLHGLQYGLWTQHAPTQNLASWAYQRVCDYLWNYRELPKTQDLISYIYDSREALDEDQSNIADAFSTKSVNSAYDWLLPLSPPVLQGVSETSSGRRNFKKATFALRASCSPALFLMGLSWMAREAGNEFGELMAIDAARRLSVCRFCLIEENQFDFMLKETLRRFSYISVQRTVGLYLVIEREPKIADF
jgi:hypothetical protein